MDYRVSVFTPIYKGAKFIDHFLEDLRRQSIFHETEFLLLDADSPEQEYASIEKYLGYKNIKYINTGKCPVYESWNKGVELASAPLIGNWNLDDRRIYNSLQKQVEFLEENSAYDVCYGPTLITHKPNQNVEFCDSKAVWQAFEGTIENQLRHNSPHCLPVWRTDIHEKWGNFDTSYFSAADYDMWFRVLKGGGKLKNLDFVVGSYYKNPLGISSNQATLGKALEEVEKVRERYSV
jgi:glycosyltransferase involved in cell wall biosynthesis